MANFDQFTGKYSLQKTLRFALTPVGKTAEHIREKKLLQTDEDLAAEYKNAKKIIDAYHRHFIGKKLADFRFGEDDLRGFSEIFNALKAETEDKSRLQKQKDLNEAQDQLRKQISKKLQEGNFLYLKGENNLKDFIKTTLPNFLSDKNPDIEGVEKPTDTIKKFENRTTYFYGFNENRKNIYTHEAHSTAVAYRVVHENLPRFLDNINRYKTAKSLGIDFSGVEPNADLDRVFSLQNFNNCLTQKGIDNYNAIRGGEVRAVSEHKQQGINEKINLHAQQLTETGEKKKVYACKLEKLHKQILSEFETDSFRFNEISSDADLCEKISSFHLNAENTLMFGDFDITDALHCLETLDQHAPEKLYLKNTGLKGISREIFGDWGLIQRALEYYAEHHKFPANNKTAENNRKKWLNTAYFSFADIHKILEVFFTENYGTEDLPADDQSGSESMSVGEQRKKATDKPLYGYFRDLKTREENLLENIAKAHRGMKSVVAEYREVQGKKLKNEKESKVGKVKNYLDAIMDLHHFIKPLFVQTKEKEAGLYEKDNGFYDGFDALFERTRNIIPLYNQTRNYLTQKPYSVEKFKLNFDIQTLAKGWAQGNEKANRCLLFKKGDDYYLGIMAAGQPDLFAGDLGQPSSAEISTGYQKMVYQQIADAGKDIQNLMEIDGKVTRKTRDLPNLKEKYAPEIAIIKATGTYKKTIGAGNQPNEQFNKNDLATFIAYYQKMAKCYWGKLYDFSFKLPTDYDSFKEFTDDINRQGYKIIFRSISADYINRCVSEGKLYLFRIYSKDFSQKSKGKPNLNTIYFKMLFDESNLANVVYKLNGEAELFYRKHSITYKPDIWEKGHHARDKKQPYPIIKDRRYACNTYLFHLSVTVNFRSSDTFAKASQKYNTEINRHLHNNKSVKILGIDRGERHLAYYTLINQAGEIEEHGSFNNPFGEKDYHNLLDQKENERGEARRSWRTIENIKDLKSGYLSQVVHKICKMIIEHNAIVVFEDLNFGFKKGRIKIEKQVYQKLEKMLIEKLNYLVFKDRAEDEIGGALSGYQLTAPFVSFQSLGKQTGVIFYVPAYHTSKVCPATGFVDLIHPRFETIEKSRDFFGKFAKICHNRDAGYFEFHIDSYEKFTKKAADMRQKWLICSHGRRLENKKQKQSGKWETHSVDLNEELIALFGNANIDYSDGICIKEQICSQSGTKFFSALFRLLRLTLQMRNSRIKTEEDWLISPVQDKNGKFFDSRSDGCSIPNADANGAYHIALKGLWCLQQINHQGSDIKPNDLKIKNNEWYSFVQNKPFEK